MSRKRKAGASVPPEQSAWSVLAEAVRATGGSLDGVEPRSAGAAGCGLFATRDLAVGDVVACVPPDAVISAQSACSSSLGRLVAAHFRVQEHADDLHDCSVNQRSVLYLYLIAARAGLLQVAAAHAAYARALPVAFNLPVTWPEGLVDAELGGTELQRSASFMHAELREWYNRLCPRLFLKEKQSFPRNVFAWEAFLWAHAAYSSRAFPASCLSSTGAHGDAAQDEAADGVLIPLLDVANHAADGADMCACASAIIFHTCVHVLTREQTVGVFKRTCCDEAARARKRTGVWVLRRRQRQRLLAASFWFRALGQRRLRLGGRSDCSNLS